MKTKKVLLGSLMLAGLCAACTNEEIVDVAQNDAALGQRTQVNLTLSAPSVESRMGVAPNGYGVFTANDVMGAVLVDNGYTNDAMLPKFWNNVDWEVSEGHVGNNKWTFDGGKFTTEGTTAVGSWLFYTKYNNKMTTTRNGVEFDFPQIQDGAADLSKIYNNNINFFISPVVHIDGYEGENLEFPISMVSIFNTLNMKFDFKAFAGVKSVQKVVVTAKDALGYIVPFPAEYRVLNRNLAEARLSIAARGQLDAIACPDDIQQNDLEDMNDEMKLAVAKLTYNDYSADENNVVATAWSSFDGTQYKPVAEARSTKAWDKLVVDFEAEHGDKAGDGGKPVVDGLFDGKMLIPAGVYEVLSFEIYTNAGVYNVTVNNRYACADNMNGTQLTEYNVPVDKGINELFLRPGKTAELADIENAVKAGNTLEYIKVTATAGGDLITKTADLINFINGITAATAYNANVLTQDQIGNPGEGSADDAAIPAHTVVVNQAVMDAIVAKETELAGDIQLNFIEATGKAIKVIGNAKAADALDIHDLSFTNGSEVVSGYVLATEEITTPETILVKGGANLQLALVDENIERLEIESGAKVTVKNTAANINAGVLNNGSLVINNSLNVPYFTNKASATVKGELNISIGMANAVDATLENQGVVTLKNADNAGTWNNSGLLNVHGTFTNDADANLTIAATGDVIVNSTSTGNLTNNGNIVNNGELYTTIDGSNTIDNLGTIEANEGSRTWITANSSENEKDNPNGTNGVTMGTIKMAKRNANLSVTKKNQQGYLEFSVAATDLEEGILTAKKGDKFNKVILATATELSAEASYINFIETSADVTLPKGAKIQELAFTADAALYAEPTNVKAERVLVSALTINEGVTLDIPTENALYIYTINTIDNSFTPVGIYNLGKIMLGGEIFTSLHKSEAQATSPNGIFGSGHGDDTAYKWNYTY